MDKRKRTGIPAALVQDELAADLHFALGRQELLNVFEAVAVQDEEAVVRCGCSVDSGAAPSVSVLRNLGSGLRRDAYRDERNGPGEEEHGSFDARLDLRDAGQARRGLVSSLIPKSRSPVAAARQALHCEP